MQQNVIRAKGLCFAYGLKNVLSDFELRVPRGSIYGLLGPNGCGKSTFLRLVLGLGRPFQGTLKVFGEDPSIHYVSTRASVGYVPQENDLDPELNIEQTLALFEDVYSERWSQEVARDRLHAFGLEKMMSAKVGKLSGGYQQRLALLTAIAIQPEILLLDEPTSGLDAVIRRDFIETVIDFVAKDPQRSVVISSHLLSEIEPLVDHIGLISTSAAGSKMLIEAPLENLKERTLIAEIEKPPSSLFDHPLLLSRQVSPPEMLIFWLEKEEDHLTLREQVQAAGGRIVEQADLDEIFVRLMRAATPVAQRRVVDGKILETQP